jgi:hypothetical protein
VHLSRTMFSYFTIVNFQNNAIWRDSRSLCYRLFMAISFALNVGRHDIQHNDTQHNDIPYNDPQHEGLIWNTLHRALNDTQHKSTKAIMLSVIILNVAFYLLLCWVSLCWMSLCWVPWHQMQYLLFFHFILYKTTLYNSCQFHKHLVQNFLKSF